MLMVRRFTLSWTERSTKLNHLDQDCAFVTKSRHISLFQSFVWQSRWPVSHNPIGKLLVLHESRTKIGCAGCKTHGFEPASWPRCVVAQNCANDYPVRSFWRQRMSLASKSETWSRATVLLLANKVRLTCLAANSINATNKSSTDWNTIDARLLPGERKSDKCRKARQKSHIFNRQLLTKRMEQGRNDPGEIFKRKTHDSLTSRRCVLAMNLGILQQPVQIFRVPLFLCALYDPSVHPGTSQQFWATFSSHSHHTLSTFIFLSSNFKFYMKQTLSMTHNKRKISRFVNFSGARVAWVTQANEIYNTFHTRQSLEIKCSWLLDCFWKWCKRNTRRHAACGIIAEMRKCGNAENTFVRDSTQKEFQLLFSLKNTFKSKGNLGVRLLPILKEIRIVVLPLGMPEQICSFSKLWKDARSACDIFWLVPGVSGGIAALLGMSANDKNKKFR